MSGLIRAGSKRGDTLVEYPSQPTKARDAAGNWTLTYKYWCLAASAESLTPATGSAPPGGVHPTLEITQVTVTPQTNPKIVDIEFVYAVPSRDSWVPVLPGEVRYETDVGVQDAPLVDRVIDLGLTEAQKNDVLNNKKKKTYLAPVPIFRRIENVSSFALTEANIVENVGKREAPTDMTSPTAGKWLKTRRSMSPEGSRFIVTEEWAYSTSSWDGEEYENA